MHLINCSHHNSWAGLCLWCGYLYSRAVDSDEGRRLRFTYIDKSLANKSYWNHVSWRFNIIIAVLKITLSTTIMVALSGITSNTLFCGRLFDMKQKSCRSFETIHCQSRNFLLPFTMCIRLYSVKDTTAAGTVTRIAGRIATQEYGIRYEGDVRVTLEVKMFRNRGRGRGCSVTFNRKREYIFSMNS